MSITHGTIIGGSKTGKTTLAKRLSVAAATRSIGSIIFDPYSGGTGNDLRGWRGWVTNDFDRFLAAFWANRSCVVFIDEARRVFIDHKREAVQLLTEGRHVCNQRGGGGHVVWLLAQRFTNLEKTARDQATNGYIFRVAEDDAANMAKHWAVPAAAEAHRLPPLHYLRVRAPGFVQAGRLTF